MRSTSSPSAKRALAALAASSVAVLGVAFAAGTPASAGSPHGACSGSYGWPVKPFDRVHPIRANFGDPRTRFDGPRTVDTLFEGHGTFSFHQGIDISAPDGEPVYPVASGTVTFARGQRVTVTCGNGRSFQYWHIFPRVRAGQRVEAGETVLGFIQPKREHVHLTHLKRGRAVNPLAPGRLTPYRDATSPHVLAIEVGPDTGPGQASRVEGRVTFVVEAVDAPPVSVPGRWHGFPVTPARLTWRLQHDGRVLVRGVTRDARRTVPRNDRFWETFARGTHQNWPIFAGRKFQFEPGKYLFRLTARPFDTRRLADGTYTLVVSAEDTAGNRDLDTLRLTVDNSR
jgi:murein DD-endopeptidase MepM/ murein hydrolase activator NlpD